MIRTGLIGRSILASRSPWLHEEEARAQGLELSYTLFDFDARGLSDAELPQTLADLRNDGFSGVNITYPFKQAVIPLLDELADSALTVGAVNTVAMQDGVLTGHNTDMTGFGDSLRAGLPQADLGHVLQLGAGGAGAAVASALLSLGTARLSLCDVDTSRAQALAQALTDRFGAERVRVRSADDHDTADVTGIVNATPIGMMSLPGSPIAVERLEPHHWVADIVYFPRETELLRAARQRGCATLDGTGMVVRQAAQAFRILTGHTADSGRMRLSLDAGYVAAG